MTNGTYSQDRVYEEAASIHGAALERLARSYEADADICRDLLQDIHIALWRSFDKFDNRCSMRTWVYRVAHNVATSHVEKQARIRKRNFVSLDHLESLADENAGEAATQQRYALDQLYAMIRELKPLDRQVMLMYLEGMNAAETADVTGLSERNVATKIHRIKQALGQRFRKGGDRELRTS
jgi:RNA polymerase sigma-70 factor (ECF subfamily)